MPPPVPYHSHLHHHVRGCMLVQAGSKIRTQPCMLHTYAIYFFISRPSCTPMQGVGQRRRTHYPCACHPLSSPPPCLCIIPMQGGGQRRRTHARTRPSRHQALAAVGASGRGRNACAAAASARTAGHRHVAGGCIRRAPEMTAAVVLTVCRAYQDEPY